MNRLLQSRKLWGALLGSICIIIAVKLTPDTHVGNIAMVIGGLWTIAIGGQAAKDYLQEKNQKL